MQERVAGGRNAVAAAADALNMDPLIFTWLG